MPDWGGFRIGVDSIFLHIAAENVDAGDALYAAKLGRNDPVLHRPQISGLVERRRQPVAFRGCVDHAILRHLWRELDRVDEDLAQAGRHWTEHRRNAGRQSRADFEQTFHDQLAGEIDVGLVAENQRDAETAFLLQCVLGPHANPRVEKMTALTRYSLLG